MEIDKKDLLFNKSDGFMEVWSKVDPGEHSKDETAVLVKSKMNSMFKGAPYRGIILKESFSENVNTDISELKEIIKEIKSNDFCSITESGTILMKLPKSNASLELKFLKGEDEVTIEKILDKRIKNKF